MPTAGCTVHIIIRVPEFLCVLRYLVVVIWRYLPIKKYRHNIIMKHAIIAKMKNLQQYNKEDRTRFLANNKLLVMLILI